VGVVGLIVHHERETATDLAIETARFLVAGGHEVRLLPDDAEVVGLQDLATEEHEFAAGLDVAVSLGGDGTMLRTVELVAAQGVPVIGVNLGQLGYLTEVDPEHLHPCLESFFAGTYGLEERMLLRVVVDAPSGGVVVDEAIALNEAVLEKTLSGHTVRLDVEINGQPFTPYATDGLIIATPTGSTAYAFSARGPIIAPTHRSLQLTPVSPHMLFDRTLILDPDATVRITVEGHRPAFLSVDGRPAGELKQGDAVVCSASPFSARLVVFAPRDFHQILKAKFGLSDR
jgi:NAD+ kinase